MDDDTEDLVAENARLRAELRALRTGMPRGPLAPPSSEQVYESIFRLSPSNITVTRFEDGTYYDVNDTFCRTTAVSREQALKESSLSLNLWVDPADRDKVKSLLERSGTYSNVEIDYNTAGTVRHMLQSAELVRIGEARYIIAVSTDITERKVAEATLARERERLSVTLQSLSDGVISIDADSRVEILNRVAAKFLGVESRSVLGQPVHDLLCLLEEGSREPVENPFQTILARESAELAKPFVLVSREGTERMVVLDGAPIASTGGAGTVLVLRDVTEKLRMEEHLRKASRLESLGILAGGIAHDFNNVLMGIQSNITFARTREVDEEERQEALVDVEGAVRHARDLTQQLLTFSRGGAPIKSNASIGELLEEVTGFALRGSAVAVDLVLAQGLSAAAVDRSQIAQVIENLIVNAVQAMPEGGLLRVAADNVDMQGDNPLALSAGPYVRFSVQDTGPGISDSDLPHIFDPFFSRRPGGTGLGLSIVHSIVRRHGGAVQVDSQVGKGSRFEVYLPASDKSQDRPPAASSTLRSGDERILVMDDDAMVRRSLQRLLAQLGYRVDVVADGEDAIEAFKRALEEQAPFALVFLDLTVPGRTGGKDAARALKQMSATTPVVVSSGYSDDTVMANPHAYGFDACIAKPHQAEELGRVLDRFLG